MRLLSAGSVSGHRAADETTKCPESLCPMSAVRASGRRVHAPPRALPLRLRSYGLLRQSPWALPSISGCLIQESGQVATSPCCPQDLPGVISANLSPDAWSHATAVPQSALACFFPCVIGLPLKGIVSASRFNPRTQLCAGIFSRLQTFLDVQASEFARFPGCSYRCAYSPGRLRLLRPGISCFVASALV